MRKGGRREGGRGGRVEGGGWGVGRGEERVSRGEGRVSRGERRGERGELPVKFSTTKSISSQFENSFAVEAPEAVLVHHLDKLSVLYRL